MPKINKEELKKIRRALPEGAIEAIAGETGLCVSSIRQILFKPERFNKKVLELAVSLGERHAEEIKRIISRANSL